VTVNQSGTGDFRLDQTVISPTPGSTCPSGGTDPRCATTVPVASLRIVNATDASTTEPTSVVHDTVTLTNIGQVPYVGIAVTDDLTGSIDDATYDGDAQATAGSVVFAPSPAAISWTGDLPVGATVTVTASLTVNYPDTGDKNLRTLVTTTAGASNCPVTGPAPACATSVPVLTPALTIVKTVDRTTATPGTRVDYTITATDTGQTAYTAATITDSLHSVLTDATYGADAVATTGVVAFADQTLTWTGDLAVGQTAVITYSVLVDDPDLGDRSMTDVVVSDELGSSCPTGGASPSCATAVTVLVPAIDIAVAAARPRRCRRAPSATPSPCATPARRTTRVRASRSDWPVCWTTPTLPTVPSPPPAPSRTPPRT
jgi:uncharacterized repeat protein (TIGR01451 family)